MNLSFSVRRAFNAWVPRRMPPSTRPKHARSQKNLSVAFLVGPDGIFVARAASHILVHGVGQQPARFHAKQGKFCASPESFDRIAIITFRGPNQVVDASGITSPPLSAPATPLHLRGSRKRWAQSSPDPDNR